ncbi:gluconokinase [Lactobacillus sp. Sy-1]|uniref:gluconokinase n=1 Tax=Lactobacillus sp. Sy-1 TaxID=2109645 RepID=UPI001C56E3C3|nr:gluconokinase [Lactobacillus sp. Sy-1]MBW1605368.1 gluconokinase [Lactobacillus sp. Sy-1]
MNYIIGVDIGTTSAKVILYDQNGQIIGVQNNGYPMYQDTPDMSEEDPDEILEATVKGIRRLADKVNQETDTIKGVSFSCAMHSLIVLDENYKPLTRAITWGDNRAYKYAHELKESELGKKLYEATGTPIHPMTPLSKILWLKNDHKDIYDKARWYIGIKEYILHRFFGVLKEDYSIANATGMFNIYNMDWDEDALKLTGVRRDQLPELVDTTYQLRGLHDHTAKFLHLDPATPFVIGSSDGPLANLGVNAIQPGVEAVTIGTSGAVRIMSDKPKTDKKGRVFCYYLTKGMWVIGGPVNNGGSVFKWVKDQLCAPEKVTAEQMGVSPYEILTKIAAHIHAGSDGLIFHPYLGGERAPIWNANARGSFFGLTRIHTRAHMIRAALEGIVYNLYTVSLALKEVVGDPKSIQVTGGFAQSAICRQIISDIFEQEVHIPESVEGTALGAATLGMYSLGMISDLSEVKNFVGKSFALEPNQENYEIYRELLPIYIRLTREFESEYKNIADFQRKHDVDLSN